MALRYMTQSPKEIEMATKNVEELSVLDRNYLKQGLTVLLASLKRSITTEKDPGVKVLREQSVKAVEELMTRV